MLKNHPVMCSEVQNKAKQSKWGIESSLRHWIETSAKGSIKPVCAKEYCKADKSHLAQELLGERWRRCQALSCKEVTQVSGGTAELTEGPLE